MISLKTMLLLVATSNPGDMGSPASPSYSANAAKSSPGAIEVLDFTADWCPACKAMDPTISRLQKAGIPVQRVNIDQRRDLAARYRISSIPALLMIANGQVVGRLNGPASYDRIATWYRRNSGQRLSGTLVQRTAADNRLAQQSGPEKLTVRGQSPERSRLDDLMRKRPPTAPAPIRPASFARSDTTNTRQQQAVRNLGATDSRGQQAVRNLGATDSRQQLRNGRGEQPGARVVAPVARGGAKSAEERAFRATVRIKVEDATGFSYGTGTIIDTHNDEALVLTCGHLFRSSRGRGKISVDLQVPDARGSVPGELIAWDADQRDIAVFSIRPGVRVEAAPVAGTNVKLVPGGAVFSVGCNHGKQPTTQRSQISALNRYTGAANIEVKGKPVDGRSGGGLFDHRGQLIGVCRAADHRDNEGIYVGLPVIHWQLDQIHQSLIYQQPARQTPPAADREAPIRLAQAGPISATGRRAVSPAAAPPAGAAAGPEEMICIVRQADGSQRTIVVRGPSRQLLEQVVNASHEQDSSMARRGQGPQLDGNMTVRGQDPME